MPDAAPKTIPGAPAMEMIDVAISSLQDTEQIVLEGINWRVAVGDYWAVGGLHASGKSDLLATAVGIMRPVRGRYRVFGQELGAGFEEDLLAARLRLGLVFEGGRLFHHLSVAENIALPLCYHRNRTVAEAAEQVQVLLELTALDLWADKAAGELRRNWQQRTGLARALALEPDVLLLDNPLTGLDPREAFWWLNLLDQLATGHPILGRRPMTLVVAADDLRPWRERARQFAMLKNKEFINLGTRATLTTHADSLFQELLGTMASRP